MSSAASWRRRYSIGALLGEGAFKRVYRAIDLHSSTPVAFAQISSVDPEAFDTICAAMPGLVAFFDTMRACDIGFILATNNATKTATMYTERLARFGVDVPPHQILTSAEATASYLAELYHPGSPLNVIGAMGLALIHISHPTRPY